MEEHLKEADVTYYGDYVSVAVLSFGRIDALERCLDSIWQHTKYPYELIVCDDGSPGTVQQFLLGCLRNGRASELVLNPPGHNMGVGVAINRGFSIAHGNYLVKMDADMEVSEGWLEDAVNAFTIFPELAWWAFARYPHGETEFAVLATVEREGLRIQTHYRALSGAFMIRRDAWEVWGPLCEFNTSFSEDWNLQSKVVPQATCREIPETRKPYVWAMMQLDGRWLGAPPPENVRVREQPGAVTTLRSDHALPTPIHFGPLVLGNVRETPVEMTKLRGQPVRPWNYIDRPDLLEILQNA